MFFTENINLRDYAPADIICFTKNPAGAGLKIKKDLDYQRMWAKALPACRQAGWLTIAYAQMPYLPRPYVRLRRAC